MAQPGGALRIAALRGADGRIAEFAAIRADGTAPPADEARDALLASWRAQFATLSLAPRRIAPREDFAMPVPGSDRSGTCRPEGLGSIAQRPVLVARCEAKDAAGLDRLKAQLVRQLTASGLAAPDFSGENAGH